LIIKNKRIAAVAPLFLFVEVEFQPKNAGQRKPVRCSSRVSKFPLFQEPVPIVAGLPLWEDHAAKQEAGANPRERVMSRAREVVGKGAAKQKCLIQSPAAVG
jgi:hypothetical protein